MDDILPQTPRQMPTSLGGDQWILWIAIGIAVVLFSFFLFDSIVQWRRKKMIQKHVAAARTKHHEESKPDER